MEFAFQAEGRGFEPRLPLYKNQIVFARVYLIFL